MAYVRKHILYRALAITFVGLAVFRADAQFVQQGSKLVATDAVVPTGLGVSVSLSPDGSTALVGGLGDNNYMGAAWVFTRQNGVWSQSGNKLVGSGAVPTGTGPFGFPQAVGQGVSVSLSADGNTALVGGLWDDDNMGAAWVFTRQNGMWTQQGNKLVGDGATPTTNLPGLPAGVGQGCSVSLSADGNTALVGGPYDNGNMGAAWVFTRTGGVWTQLGDKLVGTGAIPTPTQGVLHQGCSVSLSADGNTALVGGPWDNNGLGAAWVFTRQNGVWTQQKLVGSGAEGRAYQGNSVCLSSDGSTAIVGGQGDHGMLGAAWVFTRQNQNGVWTQQGNKLVGSGAIPAGPEGVCQGHSVSLSADGNMALVGGQYDNDALGAGWVFTRTGGVWAQQGTKLAGTGAVGQALQGTSVCLSSDGSAAILGGPHDNASVGMGAAWIFIRCPPPTIAVTLDRTRLWPPNHKLVTINATVTTAGSCSTPTYALSSITCNESMQADDIQGATYGTPDVNPLCLSW